MDSVTDTLVRVAREPVASSLRLSDAGSVRMRARRLDFDALVRLGFDQVRRDGARRPSFSVRLLELLADLRATGGEVAASSEEVKRQARLTCEGAVELAETPADAALVDEAYRRLHPRRGRRHGATAMALPASRNSP
ncbi:MAG: DUF2254 domain-containing protein [Thermoleophilaceae bacterium]|nr:DUF2254 domain-containing protein [Thermoleophilaceae bacterium]